MRPDLRSFVARAAPYGLALVVTSIGCGARHPGRADASVSRGPAQVARTRDAAPACPPAVPRAYAPDAVHRERDVLLMWLAYAIAYDDWQGPGAANRRGQNVAAVLADEAGTPLCWSRNSVLAEGDATQHAEVRLLTSYLRGSPETHADRLRLYATLEPCVMCAGMTLITGVGTVLYGEHAVNSGSVYERLARDSRAEGGYCPYPFTLVASAAPTEFVDRLDRERSRRADLHGWMESESRHAIHREAAETLDAYLPQHPENVAVLAAIRRFRAQVPRSVPVAPYRVGCPSFDLVHEAAP